MALNANALTTLAKALDELGLVSDSGAQDARIERYINACSTRIESYLNRSLAQEVGRVEKLPGHGGSFLLVDKTPITSIASITYDGGSLSSDDYEIVTGGDGTNWAIFKVGGWQWTAPVRQGLEAQPIPGFERELYQVTYTGGYTLPAAGGSYTLPEDIEDSCLMLVTQRNNERGSSQNIKSEKLLSASVTYVDAVGLDEGLPPAIAQPLAKYRRVAQA